MEVKNALEDLHQARRLVDEAELYGANSPDYAARLMQARRALNRLEGFLMSLEKVNG